jgi:DNA invertase Pin-like site-specific DNA recombinase
VEELRQREVGFKVLTGTGTQIDTTTANGRLVFGIFAALAEFEAALIRECTRAGLAAAPSGELSDSRCAVRDGSTQDRSPNCWRGRYAGCIMGASRYWMVVVAAT